MTARKKLPSALFPKISCPGQNPSTLSLAGHQIPDPALPEKDAAFPPHKLLTEEEFNRILYLCRKEEAEKGMVEDWPDEDSGIVMGFLREFLTPEMRESFSEIAKEYLQNEAVAFLEPQPFDGLFLQNSEKDVRDVYYLRLLAVMLHKAREGSAYSSCFLASLYKTYHDREYKYLKRLPELTIKDVRDMYAEDCYDKGYKIRGEIIGNNPDYREIIWARRRNEPGWTNIQSDEDAYDGMFEWPIHTYPPIEYIASRLFIMCELLNIPIDPTCYNDAVKINNTIKNELFINEETNCPHDFLDECELEKLWIDLKYPEMNDPAEYQADGDYRILQAAEFIMRNTFKRAGLDFGMVYGTRKFDLARETAEVCAAMKEYVREKLSFNEAILLASVSYLSKCIVDTIKIQKKELAGFFGLYESRPDADWDTDSESGMNFSFLGDEKTDKAKRKEQKLFKAIRNIKPEGINKEKPENIIQTEGSTDGYPDAQDDAGTEAAKSVKEVSEMKARLEQARHEITYQKDIYNQARNEEERLSRENAEMKTELVALRNFAYSISQRDQDERSEESFDVDAAVRELKGKKVTVLGGGRAWHNRLKEKFPDWSYIAVDDGNVREGMIERADHVYIYTGILKHKQYKQARKIIKKKDKEMFYISGRNIEDNIRQFHRELCRPESGKKGERLPRKGR